MYSCLYLMPASSRSPSVLYPWAQKYGTSCHASIAASEMKQPRSLGLSILMLQNKVEYLYNRTIMTPPRLVPCRMICSTSSNAEAGKHIRQGGRGLFCSRSLQLGPSGSNTLYSLSLILVEGYCIRSATPFEASPASGLRPVPSTYCQ